MEIKRCDITDLQWAVFNGTKYAFIFRESKVQRLNVSECSIREFRINNFDDGKDTVMDAEEIIKLARCMWLNRDVVKKHVKKHIADGREFVRTCRYRK